MASKKNSEETKKAKAKARFKFEYKGKIYSKHEVLEIEKEEAKSLIDRGFCEKA